MSTNAPPAQVMGAEPKNPVKNRVTRRVAIFGAAPLTKEKMADVMKGNKTGHLRPYTSDSGAHIKGPNPHLVRRRNKQLVAAVERRWRRSLLSLPEQEKAGAKKSNLFIDLELVCNVGCGWRVSVYC